MSRAEPLPEFGVVTSPCGTTTTVTVAGELDMATSPALDRALGAAFAAQSPPETLVVDLSATAFVDSTGIHTLLGAQRRAQATGVRLVLVPAPPRVQRVFALAGIDRDLPFVPVLRPAAA